MNKEPFTPGTRVQLSFSNDANAEEAPINPVPEMTCEEARKEAECFRRGELDTGGMALLIDHCLEEEEHDPDCPKVREHGLVKELQKALRDFIDGK